MRVAFAAIGCVFIGLGSIVGSQRTSDKGVVGEWLRKGGGLVLKLSANHTYEATWMVGSIPLGGGDGTWELHGDRLTFAPPLPHIVGHHETLQIKTRGDEVVLAAQIHEGHWRVLPTTFERYQRPRPVPVKPSDNPYLQRFMSDDFKLVHRTQDIDAAVLALLRSTMGNDRRLAEPDQPFQLSDVVQSGDDIPACRLVLAGYERDLWFIDYIHEGFSPYSVLKIFTRSANSWKIAFTIYGEYRRSGLSG